MGYEEALTEYQRYIQSEKERLKKREAELREQVAEEMAARGLLGGRTHIAGIGAVQKSHEDYLADLQRKYADLHAQIIQDIIRQREQKKQAKRARKGQYLQTAMRLALTPWEYTEKGLPKKVLGQVVLDWIRKRVKKEKDTTKPLKLKYTPKLEFKMRGYGEPPEHAQIGNRMMSFTRPSLGQGTGRLTPPTF